jgi:hypothetical protein
MDPVGRAQELIIGKTFEFRVDNNRGGIWGVKIKIIEPSSRKKHTSFIFGLFGIRNVVSSGAHNSGSRNTSDLTTQILGFGGTKDGVAVDLATQVTRKKLSDLTRNLKLLGDHIRQSSPWTTSFE